MNVLAQLVLNDLDLQIIIAQFDIPQAIYPACRFCPTHVELTFAGV